MFSWQGQKDSNSRHAVLETAALPAELYPYIIAFGGKGGIRTPEGLATPNGLANRPLQPLEYFPRCLIIESVAERVGFEPTAPFGVTGFQDQLHKPLGHLSGLKMVTHPRLELGTP